MKPIAADRSFKVLSCGRNHKSSMLYTPQAENLVGDLLQLGAPAFHDDNLQTVVMVQVHVCRSQHLRMGTVLNPCEPRR